MRLGLRFAVWLAIAVGARVILMTVSNHVAVIHACVKGVNFRVDSDPVLRVLVVVVLVWLLKIVKAAEAVEWNECVLFAYLELFPAGVVAEDT